MEKTIVIDIEQPEMTLTFNVTTELFSEFIGATSQGNGPDGAHNFVMQAIDDSDKPLLNELLEINGGAAFYLANELNTEFAPPLKMSVKK